MYWLFCHSKKCLETVLICLTELLINLQIRKTEQWTFCLNTANFHLFSFNKSTSLNFVLCQQSAPDLHYYLIWVIKHPNALSLSNLKMAVVGQILHFCIRVRALLFTVLTISQFKKYLNIHVCFIAVI